MEFYTKAKKGKILKCKLLIKRQLICIMKALKLFYKLIHKINDLWLSVIHKRPCGNIKKQNVFLASFFIRSTRIMHTVHAFSYPYDSSSERHFHSSFARAFTFSREIIRLLVENLINFCLFIQSSNICRFTSQTF